MDQIKCAFCEKLAVYQVMPERVATSWEACSTHLVEAIHLSHKYDTNSPKTAEVWLSWPENLNETER